MIDTDKYEDAQKHAWRDAWGKPYFELNEMQRFISDNGPNSCNDSDVELWADAPLLLEEVKRLREAFITAVRHVGEHDLSRDDLFSKLDEDLFSLWLFRSE